MSNPWMSTVKNILSDYCEVALPAKDGPGLFRYGDVEPFIELLERSGLSQVKADVWHGQLAVGGGLAVEEATAFALDCFGSFAELQTQLSTDVQKDIYQQVAEKYQSFASSGKVLAPAKIHFVQGIA